MEKHNCCLVSYIPRELKDLGLGQESIDAISDFTLKTEDGAEFSVHRLALVHASKYFKALVFNNLDQSSLLIPELGRNTLREILSYVYRRRATVTAQNVRSILRAADFLLLDGLVDECIHFMEKTISIRNAADFFMTSLTFWHLGIQTMCYRFIQTNFEWVIHESSDIHLLPYNILVQLLMDDYTNVSGEDIIWKAIVTWTEHQVEERSEYVYSLLRCIRFSQLSKSYINNVILKHPTVQKNEHCCKMRVDAVKNTSEYVSFENSDMYELARETGLTCVDTSIRKPKHVYFFIELAFDERDACGIYEIYNDEFDHWRKVARISEFSPDVMHAIHDTLYIFESYRDVKCAFSVTQQDWRFLPPLLIPRCMYNVLCLNNKLYVIGGCEQILFNQLTSVEVYDPNLDSWTELTSMHKAHSGPAEVLNGKIFVLGDYFDEYLKGVVICGECYDPETDTWTALSSPQYYRRNFAMVAYKDFLYIFGGRNMKGALRTVERYDPTTKEWSAVKCMPRDFEHPKATVLQDVLVVYEEDIIREKSVKMNTPIYWDETSHDWKEVNEEDCVFSELYKYLYAKVDDMDVIQQIRPCFQPTFQWTTTFSSDEDD